MDIETAILISIGIISVIAIILRIVWGIVSYRKKVKPEVKNKIRITKAKVLNKLIVKDKKEIILNEGNGSGFIYNGFGNGEVHMTSRMKHILVVYDTYTNKYDEVPVTVNTYYSTKVGDEVMFDSEEFIHYEYKYDYYDYVEYNKWFK